MSRRRYPRWHSSKQLEAPDPAGCGIEHCAAPATWAVRMEFSYLRGEDAIGRFCDAHRKKGMDDPWGMCEHSKPGAWKE